MSDTLADRLAAFALATRFEDLPETRGGRGPATAAGLAGLRRRRPGRTGADDRPTGRRADAGDAVGRPDRRRDRRARLGGVRQRRAYPLPGLQRHLSLAGAGAPERQLGGRDGGRPGRRRRRQGVDRRRGGRLRGPVPALRRRQHPRPGLGPHDLRLDLRDAGRVEAAGALARADRPRPGDRRDDGDGAAADPRRRAVDVEGLRVRLRRAERRLRRHAGRRRHDRAGPAVRRRDGVLPAGLRAVRPAEARRSRRPTTGCCPRRRSSSSRPSTTASRPSPRPSSCGPRSATRPGSARSRSRPSAWPSRSSPRTPRNGGPKTRETADHSLPYCTAVALVDGQITADQFTPERLADPALLDLVARTSVVEDPQLTAGYPAGTPNRVTVTLDDGRTLVSEIAFPPGHDKNPLTDDQLADEVPRAGRPGPGPRAGRSDPAAGRRPRERPGPPRDPGPAGRLSCR